MIPLEQTDTVAVLGNGAIRISPLIIELPSDVERRLEGNHNDRQDQFQNQQNESDDSQDTSLLSTNSKKKKVKKKLSQLIFDCFFGLDSSIFCVCCRLFRGSKVVATMHNGRK
mmetsp:Transcript_8410/g.9309  ORF Transcript_8410/g.9309 Transcript_8410/m.9309 type:complete len:113 (-) Transcript_8410:126-464(-)